jgi:plastocyanin
VVTSGLSFSPSSLTIAVGDTVDFRIGAGHNLAWGCSGDTFSGSYSQTFTTAGSYNYCCTFHSDGHGGMTGVIIVQ